MAQVADFIKMRKLLPRAEYKLLKNRKCARIARTKRRENHESLETENMCLLLENAWLRQKAGLSPKPTKITYSDAERAQQEQESKGVVRRDDDGIISIVAQDQSIVAVKQRE